MIRSFLFPFFVAAALILPRPSAALVPTEPDSAMSYIQTLSNPAMFKGRKTGLPGGTASKKWVASKFASWGLKPLIDDNLLVPFSLLATKENRGELALLGPSNQHIDFILGDDFTLCTNSGSGSITAPVTLVGHGISEPEKGWDDYGDIDLTGRIAVIVRGTPSNGEDWHKEFSRTYLYPEAVKHGAVAVLFYDREFPVNGAAIMAKAYNDSVPAGYIGDHVMKQLLDGSNESIAGYKKKLKNKPYPLALDKTLRMIVNVDNVPDATGYNVVGVVPGTDPDLKHEAVIVGGHGDHVGVNANGEVYPGADDNASGASTVMELARSYVTHPQKRTLIFCVFGGEEQGLLGSTALAPELPDTYNYVNMVNIDMVGRGEGVTGVGGGDQVGEVWNPWFNALPDSVQETYAPARAWGGSSSDHAPFRDQGIPAFTTYTRGSHDFYHSTNDAYATIQRPAVAGAVTSISRWIEQVASFPEPLANLDLAERTLWHQGYPLLWHEATGEPSLDLDLAERNRDTGFMGVVLEFPAPDSPEASQALVQRLDHFRDAIGNRKNMKLASSLKELPGNTYGLKESVYLAMDGDSLTDADTTRFDEWQAFGLHWVRLNNPDSWNYAGDVSPGRAKLVDQWAGEDVVVQMPLEDAEAWLPVARKAGHHGLFTGDWDSFASTTDSTLQQIRDTGAGVIVILPLNRVKKAVKAQDRIARFKVQLQPEGENYDDALAWVKALRDRGLDKDVLVNWIAGDQKLW